LNKRCPPVKKEILASGALRHEADQDRPGGLVCRFNSSVDSPTVRRKNHFDRLDSLLAYGDDSLVIDTLRTLTDIRDVDTRNGYRHHQRVLTFGHIQYINV